MESTLEFMRKREHTEPSPLFREEFWDRLSARIRDEDSARNTIPLRPTVRWTRLPSWVYGIAALLLIMVGAYLGRTYLGQNRPVGAEQSGETAAVQPSSMPDSTTTEALAYLERSKNLLIGLANLTEEQHASFDLGPQQEWSRKLIQQAVVIKASLNRPDQQQMRQLIIDLEIILLQLANIDVKPGVPAVELLKHGIS